MWRGVGGEESLYSETQLLQPLMSSKALSPLVSGIASLSPKASVTGIAMCSVGVQEH